MTARQLMTPDSTFAVTGGVATINQDVYQAVAWAPLSPVFNTRKLRAYFDDTPAGEQLAQSLFDTLTERGIQVFKNWFD